MPMGRKRAGVRKDIVKGKTPLYISIFVFIVFCAFVAAFIQMVSIFSESLTPVDLGVALYPNDLPPHLAVPRTWEMRPSFHRLSYGLGVSEETEIVVSYDMYKAGMNVRPEGDGYWHQAPARVHGGSPMCL